jgi:DNA-binding transcriptional ArsR family regulator
MGPAISEKDLNATFGALADETRRAIVARLASGEVSVMELARPFDMSQPAISKHLKVLERAGLISRRRDAQRRPCRLEPRRLKQIAEWVGSYRHFWEESFGRLDDLLQQLQAKEKTHDVKKTRSHRRPR